MSKIKVKELVTWSRDRTLRVWKIDDKMLKHCEPDNDLNYNGITQMMRIETPTKFQPIHSSSFQKPSVVCIQAASLPVEAIDALQITNMVRSRSPPPATILQKSSNKRKEENLFARSLTDQPTCSLHHEFSLLNTNMPHIEVSVLDAIKRYAIFNISAGGYVIVLQTTFPTEYPSPNICPEFTFCSGTTIHENLIRLMMKVLKTNALMRVKKSRTCLEQCLKALVTAMKKSGGGCDKSHLRLQSPRLEGALSGALHDACIPFPKTSAVSFNPVGILCSFAQLLNTKRLTLRYQNTTPRTLSAINGGGLLGNVMGPQPMLYTHRDSNASFYLHDRMSSKQSKNRSIQKTAQCTPTVYIYECNKILNISRVLAEKYSLDKNNVIDTCRKNRQTCELHGRYDLVSIWTMAGMIATPNVPQSENMKFEVNPNEDPIKKYLLEELIMHFGGVGDLQTAVVLSCLFHPFGINAISGCGSGILNAAGSSNSNITVSTSFNIAYHIKVINSTPNTSPYHTILPVDMHVFSTKIATGTNGSLCLKYLRSNSWSDSLDCVESKQVNSDQYAYSFIRRSLIPLYDQFKKLYAEILYGWQLLTIRALILKHTTYTKHPPQGVEFVTECPICMKVKRTSACSTCQRPVLFCALCCIPVKGAANACLACGHGGHLIHMMQWFELDNIKSDEPSTSAEMEPTTSKVITRASDKVLRQIYLIGNVTHQISGAKLPSNRQVLQVYFYNIRFAKLSQKESARMAVNAASLFWLQARLPIRDLYKCADKLIKLYNEWRCVSKKSSKGKANKDQAEFLENLDNLFDIAQNNALQMIRIEDDREFLLKQRQKGRPGCMIGVDLHLFSREKRSQERRAREESRKRKHDKSQNVDIETRSLRFWLRLSVS